KPQGSAPGVVARPYTIADLRETLGEVADDPAFAADFFARYIEGREAIDYAALVGQAGLAIAPRAPGAGWIGDIRTESEDGAMRVSSATPFGTPAYTAGLDVDQVILRVNGAAPTSSLSELAAAMKPGST